MKKTKRITKDQLNDAYFRSMYLSGVMDEMEGVISGTGTELGITDSEGKAVPEKMEGLIKGLLQSLEHCLELDGHTLQKWEKDMYGSFLYCAMLLKLTKKNRHDPSMCIRDIPKSFEDIILAAKTVDTDKSAIDSYGDFQKLIYGRYREYERYLFNEMLSIHDGLSSGGEVSEFCSTVMDDLRKYSDLPFKYELFTVDLPRERLAELGEEYARVHGIPEDKNRFFRLLADHPKEFYDKVDEWCRDWVGNFGYEHFMAHFYNDYGPLNDRVDMNAMFLLEDAEINYNNQLAYEEQKKRNALKAADGLDSVGDSELLKDVAPKRFKEYLLENANSENSEIDKKWSHYTGEIDTNVYLNKFRTFIKLYYDHDHRDFCSNVKDMVQTYLIENGHSILASEDSFGLVMYQVDRAKKRIAAEVERRRGE